MQRTALRDAGATEEELRTALLRPDINPAMVSEVLGRLREGLWYLRSRDRRYLFTVKPNLNKVILDFEAEVSDEQLEHALREWVEQVAGRGRVSFKSFSLRGTPVGAGSGATHIWYCSPSMWQMLTPGCNKR